MNGAVFVVEREEVGEERAREVKGVFGSYEAARDWIESEGYMPKIECSWNDWENGIRVALFKSIDTRPVYSCVRFIVSRWMIRS